jgi:hypothetical protein
MAQAEHLPIYKAAYDLCLYLEQVVRNFSRYHKYTVGAGPPGRSPAGLSLSVPILATAGSR